MLNKSKWYAVYTKPRWEKKVAKLLDEHGIESYCPLNKVVKQWSDRKKVVLEPVFKSYVFVKVTEEKKWDIKRINGVLNYVYWLGKPGVIKETEIQTIKKFLDEFENIEVHQGEFKVNNKVRITQGVLLNYEGMVLRVSGNRAIVRIESMGLELSAEFNKKHLAPVL